MNFNYLDFFIHKIKRAGISKTVFLNQYFYTQPSTHYKQLHLVWSKYYDISPGYNLNGSTFHQSINSVTKIYFLLTQVFVHKT